MTERPARALRRILAEPRCTISVSAHDPLLARLVERAGFEIVGLSGNAVAAAYLGLPDLGFLNLSDMASVARRVAGAVSLPVLVDADTGYGNALAVLRTVRELERAGAAGIVIEDQVASKKCAMIEAEHPVVPAEEHAAKIRAACAARSDPDFVIGARTDAAADLGLDEAIRRGFLYAEAGADLLNIQVAGLPQEIERIGRAGLPVPLMASMDEGKPMSLNPLSLLASAGYRIASFPGVVRYTVVRAVRENLAYLREHQSTVGIRDRMATVEEYFAAVDLDRFLELEQKLLGPLRGEARRAGPVNPAFSKKPSGA
ncbi:MAG TPA: oxaloacetate decarboxylase [candidate division Zixibacteria bacterium]|nr:oxaloacetate decarboxylase [candidate division Zixibacteria bacterium]